MKLKRLLDNLYGFQRVVMENFLWLVEMSAKG